ncbi:LysR family transcriptional regulator [Aureimonas endophytica]|uniref:LysR family transcriptional regulator n=1 Tax=Aureimonas endophytica TaxID=2027858 RepID=A0A916ZYV3_9HYPH|nr:LysR substrate-binding domain-containing protein [Aureimonas endophytica]GGE18978.1 LysR family transcriptional regulator [Aureimonas endophytica]
MQKRHDIPPLAAVRVFEAVARHLSFTRAAEELGMTQAAASYQVKLLEERLGQSLFVRRARRIDLTDAGRQLAPAITDAFQRMSAAFAQIHAQTGALLSLKVHPTFAARWLAPRIGLFQLRHPEFAVRITTSVEAPNFATEEIDVAFSWGSGNWPGHVAHPVVEDRFTPMLTPGLLARIGSLTEPAALLEHPLIDPGDPWWDIWFAAAGVARPPFDQSKRLRYGLQFLEGQAVLAGRGIGLLTPAFFADELQAGVLVQPFDLVCTNGEICCLVYPEARRNLPKIKIFREWVLGEIAACGQAPASRVS